MKIAFTLCSNNYLPQAKTLGDSLMEHNPDIDFYIGLIDRKNEHIKYEDFNRFKFLEVEKIGINGFEDMCNRYSIVELITAVKPFYFQYFFREIKDADKVLYFDPDIFIYNNLSLILKDLEDHPAVLTPHINDPVEEKDIHWEVNPLVHGLYNLGFIGFSRSEESYKILDWWSKRTFEYCFNKRKAGYFVDQLWASLMPVFFTSVKVIKNYGLNVAYWNFHERKFSKNHDNYYVNGTDQLVFFHFSSFDPLNPNEVSKGQKFQEVKSIPFINEIFKNYGQHLLKNNFEYYAGMPCYFIPKKKMQKEYSGKGIIKIIRYILSLRK